MSTIWKILAHQIHGLSSLDPALSMVSMIDFANGISDNSSLIAESVACGICLSWADRARCVDGAVDSSAQSIERGICEESLSLGTIVCSVNSVFENSS